MFATRQSSRPNVSVHTKIISELFCSASAFSGNKEYQEKLGTNHLGPGYCLVTQIMLIVTSLCLYCLHYIMIIQIITCLNLPYERGWCDCFCQLMMHCAGKHWSAHSCIMLTVRRGHTPRCSPHTHTCSAHNSPDMIYQGSPLHQVLGAYTNIGLCS